MESFEQTSSQADATTRGFVAPELVLSLATPALLLALVGGKVLSEAVREVGLLSEELFRGDRLPVLHFPTATAPDPDNSTST